MQKRQGDERAHLDHALGAGLTTAVAAAEPAPLFPFVLPWDDASPGITDLSGWLPKPAGKFGPVRVGPDGHLYTGDRRLRLNGVDLAFSHELSPGYKMWAPRHIHEYEQSLESAQQDSLPDLTQRLFLGWDAGGILEGTGEQHSRIRLGEPLAPLHPYFTKASGH